MSPTVDVNGDIHGADGTYQKRQFRDAAATLTAEPAAETGYDEFDPWNYTGDDVDGVAADNHWTSKDWENYYDARRARGDDGDTCSECGDDADPELDELCRRCHNRFEGEG